MRYFLLALFLLGCADAPEGTLRLDATVDTGATSDTPTQLDGGMDAD